MWHRLSLFSGGTRPKFYLGKFHCRSTFGATGSLLLWQLLFLSPLEIPALKTLPAVVTCDHPHSLDEPLILYYDSECLNHAQPFLEAALRRNLHRVVKTVDFVHLTVYKCVMNERTCPVLFLHLLIQKGNIRKETPQSIPTKPKYHRIDF